MRNKKRLIATLSIIAIIMAGVFVAVSGHQYWSRPQRVFIVIIDTLPASRTGCYGHHRNTTPNLDALAESGVRFENALSTAPWTMPAIAGILTGTYPHVHQAGWRLNPRTETDKINFAVMKNSVPTMAGSFKELGYNTVGFFNNPFVSPTFQLDLGFDKYDFQPGNNLNIRRANRVVAEAKQWMLTHKDTKVFMVLHFFDPHLCYDPLPKDKDRFSGDYKGTISGPFCAPRLPEMRYGDTVPQAPDRERIKELYDAEVVAADRELGRFIYWLKQKGLYDGSLIVVTADHGEEFWEHGGFEHGHTLYNELLHVPLIIKFPKRAFFEVSPGVVKGHVSTADIFPTVASYMKMDPPAVEGKSLYDGWGRIKNRDGDIVAMNLLWGKEDKFAFYSDGIKVIVNRKSGEVEAYDLTADPEELVNIYTAKGLEASLERRIKEHVRAMEDSIAGSAPQRGDVKPATLRMLKSLGYLE